MCFCVFRWNENLIRSIGRDNNRYSLYRVAVIFLCEKKLGGVSIIAHIKFATIQTKSFTKLYKRQVIGLSDVKKKLLTARQRAYLELLLKNYIKGEKQLKKEEMAERLGVSRQTLNNWENLEEFQKEYNRAVRSSLNASAIAAADTMVELLAAKDERARFSAAKDLLDRTGFKAVETISVEGNIPIVITGENELE